MATNRRRRRTITVSVLALLLVVILYVTGGVISGLRGAANLVVAPFSWTVNAIARPVGHVFAGAINYSNVVAQNQRLRYELGQAELRANESWGLDRQLQELGTELNVPFVSGLRTLAAQVTAIAPTNFSATVTISRGRDDGVLVGMPVVANGGLVGTIESTSAHGAVVRLLSDPSSSVGVTFATNQPSIIVTGRGVNNGLAASAVPLSTAITPGTRLFTDGLSGGLYPPGLPVATVKTATLTPGAATYELVLQPLADLRHLAYVDVVLWEPST